MPDTPSSGRVVPFIKREFRRDILSHLSNAARLDLESTISRLIASAEGGAESSKKDGKDGAADGIIGLGAGQFVGGDPTKESFDGGGKDLADGTGKESLEGTGDESAEDTGKESSDDTGKESSDDTGKESSDDTGKESSDDTGKDSSDDTGKESSDGTGKESSDDTGKESSDDTGKESSDDTGKESSDDTGKESSDDTGKEASDDTGKEASDDTGKESSDDTGKEASDDTGKEASDDTGKEASDDTGKEASDDTGKEATEGPKGFDKDVADIQHELTPKFVQDVQHWYTKTVNVKDTKDAFDDDPKGLRDTAIELPSDFDPSNYSTGEGAPIINKGVIVFEGPSDFPFSSFNAGSTSGMSVNRAAAASNLDQRKLDDLKAQHELRLRQLIRTDRPII
jgi:hypothetical protein